MTKKLPDFTNASILVIGDIMLDRYWFGSTARISPEAPVPIVNIQQTNERPGGAGNVALNMAALGVKVTLIGITGEDDAAETLKKQLAAYGIQHHLLAVKTAPTICKLRIISRHQQLLRLDFEEKRLSFDDQQLIALYQQQLPHANLVVLSDYNKGTLRVAAQLIKLAKAANIPVLVDPKGHDFRIYSGADVITPNLKEFETIVGPTENEQDIQQKAQQFLQDYHIDSLLLTRSEQGMTLVQKNQAVTHLPAHARDVFDVTGAGDTVIAVLGAALAVNATLKDAMQYANLAASLVVAKLGAASVSTHELQAALTNTEALTTHGIMTPEQLIDAVADARLKGKKIVFTNGCFDILHAGHVTYLQQAKQLGDYLIVAINDDASVKRLKGNGRPVNSVNERMAVLAGLGSVDWVVAFADDTPHRLLTQLQPDILVKGGDYQLDQVVGAECVFAYGGQVRVLGMIPGVSTTSIIDRATKNQNALTQVE